jgi:hypothetical protein
MRRFIFAAIFGLTTLGGIAASPSPASAHDNDENCGFGNSGWGWNGDLGFGGFAGGFGGYGGGFGSYYGNGGHDMVPHWHQTTTPFGSFSWFGNGAHDYQPHAHTYTPYGYTGYSASPFGYTQSFYPRYPNYTYAPW